jgi:hypothetical protein
VASTEDAENPSMAVVKLPLLDSKIAPAARLAAGSVVDSLSAEEPLGIVAVGSGLWPVSPVVKIWLDPVGSAFVSVDSKFEPAAKLADASVVDWPSTAKMVDAVDSGVVPPSVDDPLVTSVLTRSGAEMIVVDPSGSAFVSLSVDSKIEPAAKLADGSAVVAVSAVEKMALDAAGVPASMVDPLGTSVIPLSAVEWIVVDSTDSVVV